MGRGPAGPGCHTPVDSFPTEIPNVSSHSTHPQGSTVDRSQTPVRVSPIPACFSRFSRYRDPVTGKFRGTNGKIPSRKVAFGSKVSNWREGDHSSRCSDNAYSPVSYHDYELQGDSSHTGEWNVVGGYTKSSLSHSFPQKYLPDTHNSSFCWAPRASQRGGA